MNKSEAESKFRQLLLESIDESIRSILGYAIPAAFFTRLLKDNNLRREEIAQRIEDFQNGLEKVFGSVSASVMTRAIIRTFCGKLQIPYHPRSGFSFKMYVEDCRRRFFIEERLGVGT